MALTRFKLVNTEGLSGLMYQGRLISFDKIDDTRAEQLIGKTHVLERVAEVANPVAGSLSEVASTEELPATNRPRRTSA